MNRSVERLALFGGLLAAFGEIHPFCDHWAQGSTTAKCKRFYGEHLVYLDGVTVGEEKTPRAAAPTMTASARGRRAAALHVASLGVREVVIPAPLVLRQVSGRALE
ncbi:hypothetical protein ABZ712_32960 [Streptomyces sp. NPDC006906]|uniref:hypothetical protein n=1 Tax=Streptomyces sp. NPDC006906 TaxID=3154782 RepID=UPI0033C51FB6